MQVPCAQCGGKVPLERDEPFLRCPFCDSTLYLDRAATFLHVGMSPSLGEAQAKDRLAAELALHEIPSQRIEAVERLLLPFWEVRAPGGSTVEAAFSPVPVPLVGYRIPAGGATASGARAAGGFTAVPCAETAAARWEGAAPKGLSLVSVPFYRFTWGAGAYAAWVDGVTGAVLAEASPPSLAASNHRRALKLFLGLFALFVAEAALIPSAALGLLAVAATAAALFPSVRRNLTPGGDA